MWYSKEFCGVPHHNLMFLQTRSPFSRGHILSFFTWWNKNYFTNFTSTLQMVSYVLLVCMLVVLVVSMFRLATHHFHYNFCLLAVPICHFLQINPFPSMVCVLFLWCRVYFWTVWNRFGQLSAANVTQKSWPISRFICSTGNDTFDQPYPCLVCRKLFLASFSSPFPFSFPDFTNSSSCRVHHFLCYCHSSFIFLLLPLLLTKNGFLWAWIFISGKRKKSQGARSGE